MSTASAYARPATEVMPHLRGACASVAPVRAVFLNLLLDRAAPTGLAQQIYAHVREQIENGLLAPGQRLETSRRLAQHLGCSRNVVLEAIDNLVADGYLSSAPRSSVHVAHRTSGPMAAVCTPSMAPLDGLSLSASGRGLLARMPDKQSRTSGYRSSDAFPYATWASIYRKVWKEPRFDLLDSGRGQGDPGLLEALAAYIQVTRGIPCTPDNLILFETEALACSAVASLFLDRGDTVWLEVPGFCRISDTLRLAGAHVMPIPVGKHGLDVRQARILGPAARLAVTSAPWCSLAAGGMDHAHARRLLEWAKAENGWILERGCHGDIRQRTSAIPALKSVDDDGRVLHLGSLDRALLPDMSIAFLVARPDIIRLMSSARQALQGRASCHLQPVLKAFINEGHFSRHAMKVMRSCDRTQSQIQGLAARHLARLLAEPARQVGHMLVLELKCPPSVPAAALENLLADFCSAVRGASCLTDELDGARPNHGLLIDCLELDLGAAANRLPALAQAILALARPVNLVGPAASQASKVPEGKTADDKVRWRESPQAVPLRLWQPAA